MEQLELLRNIYKGAGTLQQRLEWKAEYWQNYADNSERRIGKPLFDMSLEERYQYQALEENSKVGTLKGVDCPLCKNRGYKYIIHEGELAYCECSCMSQRKNIQRAKESPLNGLFRRCKLNNFEIEEPWKKEMLGKVKKYLVQNEFSFLYLGGKSGTGKTHLAIAAIFELMQRGIECLSVGWREASRDLKMQMTEYGQYSSYLKKIKNVKVLHIDDFLWQPTGGMPSDEDMRLAKEIIDYRGNNGLKTIITSNWTLKDLTVMSEVIGGRIYEFCGTVNNFAYTVPADAKSHRLIKLKEIPAEEAEEELPNWHGWVK